MALEQGLHILLGGIEGQIAYVNRRHWEVSLNKRTAASRTRRSHVPREQSNRSRLQGTRSAVFQSMRSAWAGGLHLRSGTDERAGAGSRVNTVKQGALIHDGYERTWHATPGPTGKQTAGCQWRPSGSRRASWPLPSWATKRNCSRWYWRPAFAPLCRSSPAFWPRRWPTISPPAPLVRRSPLT